MQKRSGKNHAPPKSKYIDRVSSKTFEKKGGSVGDHGPSVSCSSIRHMSGNSFTDPNNATTEYSIHNGGIEQYIDINGIFQEGKLKVKKEGRGGKRKQFIALDRRISVRTNWEEDNRAISLENYIFRQVSECVERGNGYFYTPGFHYFDYETIIEIAETDKETAKSIAGIYNGCMSKENIRTLTGKIKQAIKK